MWFKSARVYTGDFSDLEGIFKDDAEIEAAVQSVPFRPCQGGEKASAGFAPIFPDTGAYSFKTAGGVFLRVLEEAKLLPSSVVMSQLSEIVSKKEAELGREIRKNEREALKTALVNQLLERAFPVRRDMLVYVQPQKGICAVSVSSAKRAETAIALVRQAFTTFPARVPQPRCAAEDRITSWVSQGPVPEFFELGADTVLKSSDEDGGIIRASREDLTSEEIAVHIKAGKLMTEIALTYKDELFFVLGSDLSLKRMKPLDQYLERALPEKTEDRTADLQSHLVIQGALLDELIPYLFKLFDCEE